MSEFKVGDRVKLVKHSEASAGFELGKVYEITEINPPGMYKYEIKSQKHNIGYVDEEHIELVEPTTITEVKFKNRITNQLEDLRVWLETSGRILSNPENYKQWFMGMWEKETKIKEKEEGNDMLESLNLVDLYFNEQKEKLQNERNSKVEKIRKNNDICRQVEKIIEDTKNQLNELYLSQLDDEDLEKLQNGKKIDYSKYPFYCTGEIELSYSGCYKNPCFINDEIEKVDKDIDDKISELAKLIKTVKAHVGIAKTKEEVEDILTKYDILDKKGKLKV